MPLWAEILISLGSSLVIAIAPILLALKALKQRRTEEAGEDAQAIKSQAEAHQATAMASKETINFLRTEMAALRKDLEELRADKEQLEADFELLKEELDKARETIVRLCDENSALKENLNLHGT